MKKPIYAIFLVFCVLLITTCFSLWEAGEGTLIINFGDSARSFVNLESEEYLDFNHTVIIKNARGIRIEEEFSGTSAAITVPAGRYTVSIKASDEEKVRAFGIYDKVVDLKAGRNELVNITMHSAMEVFDEYKLLEAIDVSSESPERQLYILIGDSFNIDNTSDPININRNVIFIAEKDVEINCASYNKHFYIYANGTLHLGQQHMPGTITISGSPERFESLFWFYNDSPSDTVFSRLIMYEGITIRNNGSSAIIVGSNGIFEMHGGSITGNRTEATESSGGGVQVNSGGTFNMHGGFIIENQANVGGGVSVHRDSTFNMSGGTISGNTTFDYGGGVYIESGTFKKTGGIITGHGSNQVEYEHSRSFKGHAVFAHRTDVNFNFKSTMSGIIDNLECYPENNKLEFKGDWDSDGFIPIFSRDDLESINNFSGYGEFRNFRLMDNIDLADYDWTPINSLNGTFDGNGFTISNLNINASGFDRRGLFERIGSTGIVKDLTLKGVNIIGNQFIGGIVGYNDGGKIINCSVSGSVTGTQNVGGIAGQNDGGTIIDCSVTGNVTGTGNGVTVGNIGGVVGYNQVVEANIAIVQNCYAIGNVTGTGTDGVQNIGGVVGYNNSSTVENCYATGDVSGTNNNGTGNVERIGGIVGYNRVTTVNAAIVQNCYATGNISGTSTGNVESIGGIVGFNQATTVNAIVQNCYATGNVTGTIIGTGTGNIQQIGGVVGNNTGSVRNCVALNPLVSGIEDVGCVAGKNSSATLNVNKARTDMILVPSNSLGHAENNINGGAVTPGSTLFATVFTGWDPTIWNIPPGILTVNGPLPTLRTTGGTQNPVLRPVP